MLQVKSNSIHPKLNCFAGGSDDDGGDVGDNTRSHLLTLQEPGLDGALPPKSLRCGKSARVPGTSRPKTWFGPQGWWGMAAGNFQEYEQKIRRLRDRAAEVRILAADMRHHESRASLLQIAAAYDELANILGRLVSSPNWLTFCPPSPSDRPPGAEKD